VIDKREALKALLNDEGVVRWAIRPFRTMTGGGFIVIVTPDADIEDLQKKAREIIPEKLVVKFIKESDGDPR